VLAFLQIDHTVHFHLFVKESTTMRLLPIASLLFAFLVFQAGANVLFRYGAGAPGRWWTGFLLGNLVGVTSIIFFMGIQRLMPDRMPLVLALCGGGAFISAQVAVSLVFRQPIALGQYAGIAVIVIGMCLMIFFQETST
jgi:hypothetical protein